MSSSQTPFAIERQSKERSPETKAIMTALVGASLPATASTPALARPRHGYGWHGDRKGWDPTTNYRSGNYRERRPTRNDQVYRGGGGRYYCRRNNGTTGLVIGGIAGGLLGNAVGGGTLAHCSARAVVRCSVARSGSLPVTDAGNEAKVSVAQRRPTCKALLPGSGYRR